METWDVRQGSGADWLITLKGADEEPIVNVYDGSETFTLAVWSGDDQAPAAMSASQVGWGVIDGGQVVLDTAGAAAGTVGVKLAGSDVATLPATVHRLLVRLTTGGQTRDVFEATLLVGPQPADGEALPTGGLTFDRMLRSCPTLRQFVLEDPSQRGDLSEQMNTAWLWMRRTLLYRAERLLGWYREGNLQAWGGDPILTDALEWTDAGIDARLGEIAAALDGGGLDLSDGAALEAMSHYAVAEVLEPNPGPTKEGETNWQRLGRSHRGLAKAAMRAYVARVDVADPDGRRLILRPLGGR